DRGGEAARLGGGGGEQLQEIDRGALSGEDGPRGALDLEDHRCGRDTLPVLCPPGEANIPIQAAERLLGPGPAAEHGILPGDDPAADSLVLRDELCGNVAAADILPERSSHLIRQVRGRGQLRGGGW